MKSLTYQLETVGPTSIGCYLRNEEGDRVVCHNWMSRLGLPLQAGDAYEVEIYDSNNPPSNEDNMIEIDFDQLDEKLDGVGIECQEPSCPYAGSENPEEECFIHVRLPGTGEWIGVIALDYGLETLLLQAGEKLKTTQVLVHLRKLS